MRTASSFLSVLALASFASFGSANGVAQNVTPKVFTHIHSTQVDNVPFSSLPKSESDEAEPSVAPTPDSPAPALTRVFINNVCVDAAGTTCETITSGEVQTANVYHGSAAYVFVWEIGYGTGEIATQGGNVYANAEMVGKVPVCQSGSNYTTNCPNGSTVVGFRYEWDAGYYLNLGYGIKFTAQDTSEVLPYNTYSAQLNIQYSH